MIFPFLAEVPSSSGGLLFAFHHSDGAGKGIVFVLLLGSVFSWSVMYTKYMYIRQARLQNQRFQQAYRQSRKPLELFASGRLFTPSPLAEVYRSGCRELCFHLLGSGEVDETFQARLEVADPIRANAMASVRSAMEQRVNEEALKMEAQMILLATAVSGAPFLGLLGTVWGVMAAFTHVAQAGNAQLTTLAPGVSAALLTTVTGLLVAIPAMFGYNFLLTTIRAMTVETENFAASCAFDMEHKYLDQSQ
jgi:biopolymer transport protein ExbB/TolQ